MSLPVILLIVLAALSIIGIIWLRISVSKQIQSTIYDLVLQSTDHRMELGALIDEMYTEKGCPCVLANRALRSLERQQWIRREKMGTERLVLMPSLFTSWWRFPGSDLRTSFPMSSRRMATPIYGAIHHASVGVSQKQRRNFYAAFVLY